MASIFSSIPSSAEPLKAGQYWTPTGRAADLPWASPASASEPVDITPGLRQAPAPQIAPPSTSGATIAGGAPRPTWTPPANATLPSGGPKLPSLSGFGAGWHALSALPPMFEPDQGDPDLRLEMQQRRDSAYDAIARSTIDRTRDAPLFSERNRASLLDSPYYNHARFNDLPSWRPEARKEKFIRYLESAERRRSGLGM